ncbi:TPA: hypothetical protein DEX28_02730 [Patescibacteria group bacterium]|nr:hypothetical protein [Patescibacteria group bacterium]
MNEYQWQSFLIPAGLSVVAGIFAAIGTRSKSLKTKRIAFFLGLFFVTLGFVALWIITYFPYTLSKIFG